MKKALKSIISMVLVLAVVTGLLPQGLTDLAVASAEQNVFIPATVPAGFDAVLARAETGRDSAGESSQGGWRYVTLQPENYAVITGYEGTAPQALVIPDLLGGADVVGVLEGALQDLSGVSSVEIPGNVLAMGKHALPAGAIVRAVSGSYAETWARKNGHAYTSTSPVQSNTGRKTLSASAKTKYGCGRWKPDASRRDPFSSWWILPMHTRFPFIRRKRWTKKRTALW